MIEIEIIGLTVLGVFLGIQSFWDIKERELPVKVSIAGAIAGVVYIILARIPLFNVATALLPGVTMLLLGRITKEAIGYGDGIILLVMGLFYDLQKLFSILMIAFALAGILGLMLLVIFHKKGKYEMPFIPFLFLGWMADIGGRL